MGVLFVLQKLVVVACDRRFACLGVVAEVAHIFDYFAKVVFILADELDVLLLLVRKDAGLVLLAGKLALEIGNAGSLNVSLVIGVARGV